MTWTGHCKVTDVDVAEDEPDKTLVSATAIAGGLVDSSKVTGAAGSSFESISSNTEGKIVAIDIVLTLDCEAKDSPLKVDDILRVHGHFDRH